MVRLDLASKRLGLVPQAQKIECRRVRSLKEVLKTIPSSLAQAGTDATKKKTTQKKVLTAFQQSLRKQGKLWIIDDLTKFKYALNRLKPRRDVLRRIAPFLSRHPELSWVLGDFLKKFPDDARAADILLQTLRRNPTYDSAAANYIDAMDVCEPRTEFHRLPARDPYGEASLRRKVDSAANSRGEFSWQTHGDTTSRASD